MAKKFVAETAVQKAIVKGELRAVLDVLRPLSAAARAKLRPEVMRVVKAIAAARFAYDDKTFAGWGKRPTVEQQHAAAVAALLCGTAEDVADQWYDIDQLIAVGREFSPPAMRDLAAALMKSRAWQSHIHDVQKLIGDGLSQRPDCDEYALGLMLLFANDRTRSTSFKKLFAQDPGLQEVLLRILDVEGTQDVSLSSVDKYQRGSKSWAGRLVELSEEGVYPRALLIDKTLATLERGWIQYRSGWFSSFHVLLAPTPKEMKPHARRYLALLGSRIPPTVTFALDCVATLDAAGHLEAGALLDALRPVFNSAVKGQIEAGLKLADSLVKRDAKNALLAAQAIMPALVHDSAPIQKQVLKRLAEWDPARTLRASLKVYSAGIAAVNRAAFDELLGAGKKPSAVKPISAPVNVARAPASPLAAQYAITPIETLDELVERTAYVFENDTDAEEFERVIAALVRFAPFDEAARARFAGVAKRIPKVRKPVAQQAARLLHFFLTGDRLESIWSQNYFGHPNLITKHLNHRIDDLSTLGLRAGGNLPLATPTHRRGFIDSAELARRIAGFQAKKIEASKFDMADALLRLAPGADGALAAARKLADDDFGRALRLALGDDVNVRDAELAEVARRMRGLLVRGSPTARGWQVQSKKFKYGQAHDVIVLESAPGRFNDPVARLEHDAAGIEVDGWYESGAVGSSDEGSICFYATMLPADMENFCAEGVALFSRNIDWFQAHWEHKAYLRPLLNPTVDMGPMASLLLALGLAGKEAGEAAVAVDVLVQSVVDGRLDAKLLARDVTALLRAGITACARYAKSLRAALRIDVAVAPALFAILCEAISARPADPPKDTSALLELMLELAVGHGLTMNETAHAALESMEIAGKGKALRKDLLARAA